MALQRRRDGTLTYVTGSMGSGKTSWVRSQVGSARRLLVWDGKGVDWGAAERCAVLDSAQGLRAAIFEPAARLSVRWPVSKVHFDIFCKFAWVWARHKIGVIVVDEIADVTVPGKAPQAWGEIARKSRAFGCDVYVTTQRPQECDKTAQGNAMVFHCGLMADADDQRYVAKRLLGGVPFERVAALAPLDYLQRDVRTRTVRAGRVGTRSRSLRA